MKSKIKQGQHEDVANGLIAIIEKRFKEYPQLESMLLEGVTMACNSLSNYLSVVQTQVATRSNELRQQSKLSRRVKHIDKTKRSEAQATFN